MWRRPACQTLSKTLDISSATARVALELLKDLAILLDAAVRKSKVFEDFSSYRKKTNRVVVFSSGLSSNFLKYMGHRWDHSTVKIPSDTYWRVQAGMYESSYSQLFRTTTGMQWRPDAFDEQGLFWSF